MRELDLGIDELPAVPFALLARCVDKGVITEEGALRLWESL